MTGSIDNKPEETLDPDDWSATQAIAPANVVYKIESDKPWKIGQAYSAISGVDADEKAKTPAIAGYVGRLDMKSGALIPIVDKMQAPHGLAFVANK